MADTPFHRNLFTFMTLIVCVTTAIAGTAQAVDFQRDVRPIWLAHCTECHGADAATRVSDLRLDTGNITDLTLSSGDAAVAGPNANDSELYQRITSSEPDYRMPPPDHGPPLSPADQRTVRLWIEEGAPMSGHWAYQPPLRPSLPKVLDRDWPRNPIDHFVLAKLEAGELPPSPQSDRRTLIRRLSFDLRGLPPSPSEVSQFVQDSRPDAYRKLVERYLASPQYGERMAQEWLDAARYADTTGHAADMPRTMWLYRDWVINAFNSNMSFDRFSIDQIAGDLINRQQGEASVPSSSEYEILESPTTSRLIATGFHRNSMQALGNNPRKEEFRIKGIVDRMDTTGRVWLGITVGCAECHDHKYDPLTTREYYELFAIFNNVPHYGTTFEVHGPRIKVLNAKQRQTLNDFDQLVADLQRRKTEEDAEETGQLDTELKATQKARDDFLKACPTAQVMDELDTPRDTFIHVRGNFEAPGEQVHPNLPTIVGNPEGIGAPNRLDFAHALFDRTNPLTARVAVNRFWAHFFGAGIVNTVDDFGVRGALPTHPSLLDWLAIEFIESKWNIKHLHRLIVTSSVYQQSSQQTDHLAEIDPDNLHLARGPRFRLAAEQIRDSGLMISGLMVNQLGGPSVFPYQPKGVGEYRDATAGEWKNDSGENAYRRGIYTFWQRMSPYPAMTSFDAPSRERSCTQRSRTNTPLQALTQLNDPAVAELSEMFSKRIMASGKSFRARLDAAFMLALSRPPTTAEADRFEKYYLQHTQARDNDAKQTQPTENVNGSESRVWMLIAQILLNLDETITKE